MPRHRAGSVLEQDRQSKGHLRLSQITRAIGKPAQLGRIGEYVASQIFDIALEQSVVYPGSDGRSRSDPLTRNRSTSRCMAGGKG